MSKSYFKNLLVSEPDESGVQIVQINRPSVLNALNQETLLEMRKCFLEVWENRAVKVLILTGNGEKAFIAGADISEMKDKVLGAGVTFAQLGQAVTRLLETMPKPTIAAVNGFALGGGTEMAISCDFILCSDNAVFGQPEVGLGIIPGFGGTARLAKFVGYPMAKELIYSGRKIKADEAHAIGLANHVYKASDLMEESMKLAKEIASKSLPAVVTCKKLLNEFSEAVGMGGKLDAEAQEFGALFGSHDQKEGMGAFLEKRKPNFKRP